MSVDLATEPVIHAHRVRRFHGAEPDAKGVTDVQLRVPRGSIFGLVGPSGAGKTTTVRLVLGVYPPDDGDLAVFGRPPSDFTDADQRRIGYLPQLSLLYPQLSLRHNLQFVASLYGMPWRARWWPGLRGSRRARSRVRQVLDMVELGDHQRTRLAQASGGEQRRLALAAAMVHDPELLVLDEPTAGVDPVLRERLWDHFDELRREGRTVFVTTQYVSEADRCDLVALLVEGRILHVDTPQGLRRTASLGADATLDEVFVRLVENHNDGRPPGADRRA